ncbi:Transcription intermediary factor 1-beta [Oopsacas minuta]|uniref:Transcription intermediary factor 1-beta n=1 Tax=Oopsacas minuta TaxID=111878 RepID=A0AAV7JVG3_9METZ|nr:Transcription intermediary factor 1-beta [Oopsacas minuta]
MATANESEVSNSMAICPGCHCLYKDPRLLPCCHSICLECIEVTNNGLSRCPKCHNVSDQKPSDLCYDVTGDRVAKVQRIRDELNKCSQILCSDCEDETDATYFCITCSNPLCDLDFKVHKKMYKNSHNLVSIDKINSIEQFYNWGSVHDCKFHPNTTADHFCTTCKYLLCGSCLSHHHPNHQMNGLEDAIKRVTEHLQAYHNTLEGLNTGGTWELKSS